MKRLLCAFAVAAVAAVTAAPLGAATRWEVVNATVDEAIVDTSEAPAVAGLHPLLTEVPFSNFRYPHVDLQENVTFIADDPVFEGLAKHHGIYRSSAQPPSGLRPLVRKGDKVVAGEAWRFVWFRGLQVDGTEFIFNATDTARGRGLYYWSNEQVKLIARSGVTTLPGVKLPLSDVEYGSLDGSRILYTASAGTENLLVLHDLRSGIARVVFRSGLALPGMGAVDHISHQNWHDTANVVFRAAEAQTGAGPAKRAAARPAIVGWFGVDWQQPDRALNPARLVTIANPDTPVPLLPGRRFNDFRSAPIQSGLVAFSGGGTDFRGVYYCDITKPPMTIRPIVDTESSLPGVFAGNFKQFDIFCTVFDKSVVFVGRADDGYVGVFLYRTDRDQLFLLCDSRTPIGGKLPDDFEIAGNFLVGNRFAVTARFPDKSSGVYLATIPARSFQRIAQ